jgi:IS30 family transposase
LKKAAHNRSEIAAIIGVHKSTIGSELSRNSGRRGYRPKQADQLATARHLAAYRPH